MRATTGRWLIYVCFFVDVRLFVASQNSKLSYVEAQAVSRQTETPFEPINSGVRAGE